MLIPAPKTEEEELGGEDEDGEVKPSCLARRSRSSHRLLREQLQVNWGFGVTLLQSALFKGLV